jgi:transcriptional regulator with GAF, ATPase, and Fis domain
MSPRAWLHELGRNDEVVRSHAIDKMNSSVGTDPHADIQVRGRGVAAVHCQLRSERDGLRISAFGERLVLNGRRTEEKLLESGDVIDIGSVRLRFELASTRPERSTGPTRSMAGTLRALAQFSEALASKESDIDALLTTLLDAAIGATRAARGFVVLFVDDTPQVTCARNMGGSAESRRLISDSIVQKVAETRKPLVISDALHDTQFNAAESVLEFKLCSVLCTPLLVRGELLGVLYLGNDNVVDLFSDQSLEVATVFAGQAAVAVRNAILIHELQLSNQHLTQQIEDMRFGSLVGASPAMREVFKRIEKVAAADVSVLIEGETGTGKELVAHELHRRSARVDGPFVVINCGAIPENLLESELFGHVRGAFTGAVADRDGKFQLADGGTLFLDEIGEMPLNLQVKLLRVLEERKVTRVGDGKPRSVDIRVVAATNRNLAEEVREGRFREDLYYRLNVVRLELAPLREREDDVVLLARYFLKRYQKELGVPQVTAFDEDAIKAMRRHRWPGNIRELDNRVKKALIFADHNTISGADLELEALRDERILPLNEAKERFALDYVRDILELNGGNRAQTARDLEVDVRTVFRYLEKVRDEQDDADDRDG